MEDLGNIKQTNNIAFLIANGLTNTLISHVGI